jgi:UDP-N-acetylglucosamine 4-epimerase
MGWQGDVVSGINRVLVTGGAGFIGSHICDALISSGIEVVCLDNLITGKIANIAHLENERGFNFIEGDIRDLETCMDAMEICDAVNHQAALGSVPRSVADPVTTHSHNATGTLNVFHAANKLGIKRVVYASSSSTYGDESTLPKIEQKIGVPLSPYAVTKRISEMYSTVFSSLHGMELIGLRYFNIFGPRQDPEGMYAAVIPKFASLILDGEVPQIHGDGEQSRDFTHISNAVQANINALLTNKREAFGKNFNIACGCRITINELYELVSSIVVDDHPEIDKIKPKHVESRAGDVKHSLADITMARELLDYSPNVSVEEGLISTVRSFY